MTYMLWDGEDHKWFKERYDNITDARKSAYRRKCLTTEVCAVKGRDADIVGTVMNKNYNMYGRPIYITNTDNPTAYYLNPDGSLGKKVD